MQSTTRLLALVLLLPSIAATAAMAQGGAGSSSTSASRIPAPAEVLGFAPGDDRKLASWNQVIDYFDKLDHASDRVKFETLGKTTMKVPFVMATISTPENLAKLDDFKRIQELLADPRKLGAPSGRDRRAAELINRGKTIVLITCGIHSNEVGSYLSSMLIAHELASSDRPEILEMLRNTIILLVPSLNPDGVDIVKNWYDKTLGTPYEGTSPPQLYHKYVGHDNNRDWYAFTQVETQITVDKIHNVWRPQIVHDIHQQGEYGARLFLPPYMAPVEPNVPKQIIEGYTELGNFMARELRANAFRGITTNSTYDAWTPARAYSHYHGGVRILSETASARIASPITVKFDQLRSREGFDPQKASDKFGPVWRGGDWNLRDITNYMTTAAFTLLSHASANRERWLRRFYEIGKEAVRPRAAGELRAFVIPYKKDDPEGGARRQALLNILKRGGVETQGVKRLRLAGNTFAEGSTLIRVDQPYGSFAKALLERQVYPNLRDAAGNPIQPYDVTSHSLGLLMDVPVTPVYKPVAFRPAREGAEDAWLSACGQRQTFGLYRSFVPSMDEGWTRWIFEERSRSNDCFRYESLTDREMKPETLNKFRAIVIPDQTPAGILNGYRSGAMPSEYTGGMGQAGVKALQEFVEQGGTVVFLNRASSFAIEQFKLPVNNVVAGVSPKEFFVPGSVLSIELDTSHPIAREMSRDTIAWVEDSPVFELTSTGTAGVSLAAAAKREPADKMSALTPNARIVARYPTNKNPLLSGWLLGDSRIRGKAALVEVTMGKGRIILFGFRPQYRAQSLATYPLLFNALSGK